MKRYLIAGCVVLLLLAGYAIVDLVRVPHVAGTYEAAAKTIHDAGLFVTAVDASGQTREPHDLELVVDQSPAPGSIVRLGSSVTLHTRVPSAEVTVPDVIGRRVSEAVQVLHDAGLTLGTGGVVIDDGIIASTFPAPRTVVPFGTVVSYVLKRGT